MRNKWSLPVWLFFPVFGAKAPRRGMQAGGTCRGGCGHSFQGASTYSRPGSAKESTEKPVRVSLRTARKRASQLDPPQGRPEGEVFPELPDLQGSLLGNCPWCVCSRGRAVRAPGGHLPRGVRVSTCMSMPKKLKPVLVKMLTSSIRALRTC